MSISEFTVFLVDDDPAVLRGLARLISAAHYRTRTFASPHEFLSAHDPGEPGCAVVDLAMPDLDGLELQQRLHGAGIERPIIFVTGEADVPKTVRAMKGGAIDFLTKPVDAKALLAAVARAQALDTEARRARDERTVAKDRLATLTRREHEVLVHVVAGRLNKQIAGDLGTVEKTIKVHRSRMMRKLGLRTVQDLMRFAERAGIRAQDSSSGPAASRPQ